MFSVQLTEYKNRKVSGWGTRRKNSKNQVYNLGDKQHVGNQWNAPTNMNRSC